MLVAKLIVKDVKDYNIISRLAVYSVDDCVKVDIHDRCHANIPSVLFAQCLNMLYTRNMPFEIVDYVETEG